MAFNYCVVYYNILYGPGISSASIYAQRFGQIRETLFQMISSSFSLALRPPFKSLCGDNEIIPRFSVLNVLCPICHPLHLLRVVFYSEP